MKYKFSTKVHGQEGIYGIEYDSIDKNEKALFEINSYIWTSMEVQNLINEIDSITSDIYFEYSVEGGNLLIVSDKDEAHIFNLLNKSQKEADIIWPTSKLIQFLNEFRNFLKKNGK
ncbi:MULTISPECIES: hypothetical protein [unclassified Chryseobacterium]|uniref:hypothetical protein n=1 Tax=unclassified Chryseobacterium TaxID=2593645 RepID=UPI00226992A2|nr:MULTISPECIES: hypothetical protein [unclassified Chryseobacterium]